QCHDHPFAKYTRKQFWEYAAFFGNLQPTPPMAQAKESRKITIPGTKKEVEARFLDGTAPPAEPSAGLRSTLADWVLTPGNPYFARATFNRVWAQFLGTGLIDPLEEPSEGNPPSHPELLDELAQQFASHQFDLRFLIRAILASKTYQLSSILSDPSQE